MNPQLTLPHICDLLLLCLWHQGVAKKSIYPLLCCWSGIWDLIIQIRTNIKTIIPLTSTYLYMLADRDAGMFICSFIRHDEQKIRWQIQTHPIASYCLLIWSSACHALSSYCRILCIEPTTGMHIRNSAFILNLLVFLWSLTESQGVSEAVR